LPVTGVLVHAVYLGGVFIAIGHGLPAGVAAIVVGLQPLLTALGAGWLLREKVRATQWAGLAAGFAGVALVVAHKVAAGAGLTTLWTLLFPVAVALLAITAGTLYQKRYCPSFDLRTGSLIQFIPSLVFTGLAAAATETMHIEWTGSFVFALAWLVLVLSLGAVTPAQCADPQWHGRQRGQPVLPGAALHRAGGLGPVWRDADRLGTRRHGADCVWSLAGAQIKKARGLEAAGCAGCDAGDQSLAIDTSVDFTSATTSEPMASCRSSTERVVMTEVTMPQGVSTSISETTSPRMISRTLPLNWLRTLMA